jgi:phosphoglycerate dehydrogenase-like enzyme
MNKAHHILILVNSHFQMDANCPKLIMDTIPGTEVTLVRHREATPQMLRKAEIIFGWPGAEDVRAAENLRWIHLPSAGADNYTNGEVILPKQVILTTSSGVYGLPIAEHVLAMILSYNRSLQDYAYHKEQKLWKGIGKTRDFFGSTIGIIGLGDIGSEVAKRAKALGARVLAVKRTRSEPPEYVDELYCTQELEEVLVQSDYVVLALPNTSKTQGIITEERLRKMKPDAFLVNIGRGALVDQEALINALREGWIGGAGLDVTSPEPLPEDSPLWELPNVIITPHMSGISPSNDRRKFDIFYRNLKRFVAGLPMDNVVDLSEGY